MANQEKFVEAINAGYTFEGDSLILGGAMVDGETQTGSLVRVPLETLNRHGLISGSTGTGKTKSLQVMAEQLSAQGVPVLLMDMKGDLSGIAAPSPGHRKIDERHEAIGLPFEAGTSPVEFLTLSDEKGLRLRATVTEFGPVLFSRLLDLNETQTGILAVVFKYCDDHDIPLIDLNDIRKTLQYFTGEGKAEIQDVYGRVSTTSVGAILRKLIELEQQGADLFFGERSFEVDDLVRVDEEGKGIISILRLTDIQDRPKLFSTFMLQMLAEIYSTFPEEGDMDKPKLVMFIDEAHLVFEEASKSLLDQMEAIIKLIRSKAVGIFFVTQ
ncbi:MAG: helicase HerA-like domain-containing protein, partial [Bacteroidota bacterium]